MNRRNQLGRRGIEFQFVIHGLVLRLEADRGEYVTRPIAGRIANGANKTQRRLFRSVIDSEAASLAADFACLSARFSFRDFPDFFAMA